MKLKTINGKEYFVKLKELEMNDQGEFVMMLKSIQNIESLKCSIKRSINQKD